MESAENIFNRENMIQFIRPIDEDCEIEENELNLDDQHTSMSDEPLPYNNNSYCIYHEVINICKRTLDLCAINKSEYAILENKITTLESKMKYSWMRGAMVGLMCGTAFGYWLRRS